MIYPKHLRKLIDLTLQEMDNEQNKYKLNSKDAVELLMMTAATESELGTYLWQLGGGPARGIFQMEIATEKDIWKNFLYYNSDLYYLIAERDNINNVSDLRYQIMMARVHYLRVPEKLPGCEDVLAMANYYKKYWNTYKGKAIVSNVVYDYNRLAMAGGKEWVH